MVAYTGLIVSSPIAYAHGGSIHSVLNFPFRGLTASLCSSSIIRRSLRYVASILPWLSISATSEPNRRGWRSAASMMARIFSRVRPEIPAKSAILSLTRPVSLRETCPDCFLRPGAVPLCRLWRSFAAAFWRGSSARRIASISEGKKSSRCAFSAYSPLATSFRLTKVTGNGFPAQLFACR